MEKLKVAIIGAGQIAELVHVHNYQLHSTKIEIVAIVDIDSERAASFAQRNKIPHAFTTAEELFSSSVEVDIVSVCTPNKFHYDYVMLALEHGCHVLCEKPPAIKASDAKRMQEQAEKMGSVLAYNFHHRFAEDVGIIKTAYEQNELGEVYVIKVKALRRCGIPGWGFFTNKDLQGGGPLIDIGIHMLETAMFILNYPEIKKVTATSYQKIGKQKNTGTLGTWDPEKFEVEDSVFAFIELENGATIILETAFALNIKEESIMNIELLGDKAGATVFPAEIYTDIDGQLKYSVQQKTADTDRHAKSITAFIQKCLGEQVVFADGQAGSKIQKLVETIYQAAENGKSIE